MLLLYRRTLSKYPSAPTQLSKKKGRYTDSMFLVTFLGFLKPRSPYRCGTYCIFRQRTSLCFENVSLFHC